MGSTFPDCPQYSVPTTEWKFVEDYSRLHDDDFLDSNDSFPSPSPHIDIDRLVIVLLEGRDLIPPMYSHLLECLRCRDAMVHAVSAELQRWRNTILCETRESLFGEWREAAKAYTTTLADLTKNVGRKPASELFKLAEIMEITRRLTAQVRAELDEHIAMHNC